MPRNSKFRKVLLTGLTNDPTPRIEYTNEYA